jgi:hypothetical protein
MNWGQPINKFQTTDQWLASLPGSDVPDASIPPTKCIHRPRKADTDAGYAHCMFCEETGECHYLDDINPGGYCPRHGITWEVWKEQAAMAGRTT